MVSYCRFIGIGFACIRTSIHVHDAMEREFSCDIKDKQILCTDFEMCWYALGQSHDAI